VDWWGVPYCCQFTCAYVSISTRPRDLDHLPLRFRFFWSPRPGSVRSARATTDSSILSLIIARDNLHLHLRWAGRCA
jgi:hypothetical protein